MQRRAIILHKERWLPNLAEKLFFAPVARLRERFIYRYNAVDDVAVSQVDNNFRRITFTLAVISLSAKLAKSDGPVTGKEYLAFREQFPIDDEQPTKISRLFAKAVIEDNSAAHYAKQITLLFPDRKVLLLELLERLFKIAIADKPLHPAEVEFLRNVAILMRIGPTEFQRMVKAYSPQKPKSEYAVLGLTAKATDVEIKRTYRRLIRQYHPDALASKGISSNQVEAAGAKLATINEAYDRILRKRGLK